MMSNRTTSWPKRIKRQLTDLLTFSNTMSWAISLKSVAWISVATPTNFLRSASLDEAYNIFCFTFDVSGDLCVYM